MATKLERGRSMERTPKTCNLTLIVLILTILASLNIVHRCDLASSPSPAPTNDRANTHDLNLLKKKKLILRRRSSPVACRSKCYHCVPCMPVEVLVRTTEMEDDKYYPQVWKCMCEGQLFSP